ncbi:MAG: integrase arm-type DNA-binding domain-containing protein [Ferrovibrio sp.]|uniref:tyrosine-type recombinase/integrase n=1 Tax=Ferrovibrio sp. TaxID=1917215 RepID=UPI0026075FAE|nr:site-specific integrase [Ferrovibrio sp.]MCW0235298.1 integrase arm-type DNA-binding domain-containing protein [Ferrovibrio sp.]
MGTRKKERLSAVGIGKKKPGMHADGWGLYLRVTPGGGRAWIFRYRMEGRTTARDMGLGPWPVVSLADARAEALRLQRLKRQGIDPIEAARAEKAANAAENASGMTFEEAAGRYVKAHAAGWRSAKHAKQWDATLRLYAFPKFGRVQVRAIDTAMVINALEPIWATKTVTAARLRGRIEAVLDWAAARGLRTGDNPARWSGHLANLLPAKGRVKRTQHHPALPYAEIGAFVAELRKQDGEAARALEFVILTAARTGEAIGATWAEIDLKTAVWTVPADRIKAGKEHRVPLSGRAVEILRQTPEALRTGYLFAGRGKAAPLSNMAMLKLLERMGRDDLTVHGFRTCFRVWCSEQTNFAREVAEQALAHAISDKVEAAYRRTDLFDRRRQMMDAWERFIEAPKAKAGKVVEIGAKRRR